MQLAINLSFLRPGRVGGAEIYLRGLLAELAPRLERPPVLYCPAEAAPTFDPDGPWRVAALSPGPFTQRKRLMDENWRLRSLLARHRVDVLFTPTSIAPLLLPRRVRQVATIYDLQHLSLPGNFSARTRLARTLLYRATARRCRKIIAISEFTRRELVAHRWATPDRVVAIPLGFDAPPPPGPEAVAAARARHALAEPYWIFPAMLAPHKNHELLLRALARVRARGAVPGQLVLIGAPRPGYAALERLAAELGIADRVRALGYVDRAEVFPLVAGARALLFPSRFEGFGLPLLEAMHLGTPVVSSTATSLPEVGGDAALFAAPDDPEAWADHLLRLERDPALRARLVEAGRRNTARFSWRRCAEQTLAVLREAAA